MEYKQETKNCQNCKTQFTIEYEDFNFYEKIKIPPPSWCVECRAMCRLTWRNERHLYHRECAKCNNRVISIYSKEKPFPVYCSNCWYGDGWDSMEYGMDYDYSKDFLSQFRELSNKIPHLAIPNYKNYNCDYTSWLDESKNCYMTFGSSRCEDVLFSETLQDCKNSLDLTNCDTVEYSYNSVYCHQSNRIQYCVNCDVCVECYFSFDLKGCQNCFLSYNLRHKNYMILNEQYSQEEWKKEVKKILGNRKLLRESFEKLKRIYKTQAIHRFTDIQKSYNSTGNNIFECKNSLNCFDSKMIEDCKNVIYGGFLKDCRDLYAAMKSELCHEGFSVSGASNCKTTIYCGENVDVQYSNYTVGCRNLFGCDSLRKKSFCILNKQYSEEEYKKITGLIIKEMTEKGIYGKFFPIELSPYGYNETMANVFYPMKKIDALKLGHKWQDDIGGVFDKTTLQPSRLPNSIEETDEDILKEIIECSNCSKNFKIIRQEFDSYKKLNIPIPDKCIDCRFKERLEFFLPRKLWHRKCMKPDCPNEFETSYAPDRPEIVYCEKCYQQEVY